MNDDKLFLKWENIKLQAISSTVISCSMMHMGMTIGFPNLLRGNMKKDTVLSTNFAFMGAMSTPVGSIFTSFLTDQLGRKKTLIIFETLSVFTWFAVAFSSEDAPYFFNAIGVFAGIMRGALTSHSPAFISEITHNEHRQMFLSFTTIFFTLAYTLSSLFNLFLSWKHTALCFSAIFILVTILTFFYVPESPHWLAIMKMDSRKARNILEKYNPNEKMFEHEWSVLQKKVQSVQTSDSAQMKWYIYIKQPTVYKPSIILISLLSFQQACCIYPLSTYARFVIPEISKPLEKHIDAIFTVISVIRLFISIVTTIFLSQFNQKQLLTFSWVGMVLSCIGLVGIELVKPFSQDVNVISWNDWLSITFFLLYTASACVAANGVPWTIIFELLPTEIRGNVGPFFVAYGYGIMALFLSQFLSVMSNIGVMHTFLYIGLFNFVGTVFIHYCVPETRGKSLYQIEEGFTINTK